MSYRAHIYRWANFKTTSSVGNGASGAFLRNALEPKAIPCTTFPLNGKLNGNNHWK